MRVPIVTARRERLRKSVEDQVLAQVGQALAKTTGEAGLLEKSYLSGLGGTGFGSAAAALMSAANRGGPVQSPTSWSNPGGLTDSLIARVTRNLATGFDRAPEELEAAMAAQGMSWGPPFPPGRPLDPLFGAGRPPRTWDYRVGENVQLTPRWNRVSFKTLKGIYEAYDVAQICVRHLINDVRSLDYNWEPIPGVKDDVSADIEAAIAFFESPDKRQPFRNWLHEWLQDVLRYDAGSLYIRQTMGGDPLALEVVSGSTIIPLIDYFGRRPQDEDDDEPTEGLFEGEVTPAYLQIIEGIPWDWLAADDLIYQPWNPMPESQYGLAPLEAVLLSANTDIRFQWHFLQFFTEGTIPAGFMEAPPDMSDPSQVRQWEETWNAVMLGDQAKLRQVRWVPSGTKWTPMKATADRFDENFPLYLMRRTCAAFGVTPNDLGFTENVNRATGDTQIDVQFRVGTAPLLRHVEDVINLFARQYLRLRCRIRFDDGKETEDRVASAQAAKIDIESGVISADERRQELGYPVDKSRPTPRFINNARSGPIPLLALESMAGRVDPETFGPADDQPLVSTPPVPPPGVLPPQGSEDQKAVASAQVEAQHRLIEETTGEQSPFAEPELEEEEEAPAEEQGDAPEDEEARKRVLKGLVTPSLLTLLKAYNPVFDDELVEYVGPDGESRSGYVQMVGPNGDVALADEPGGEATVLVGFEELTPVEGPFVEVQPGVFEASKTASTMVGGTDGGITAATGIQGSPLHGSQDEDDDDEDEVEKELLAGLALRRWAKSTRNRLRKGRRPRRWADEHLPIEVHDAVWAKLQHARSREAVDAAFAVVGKAGAVPVRAAFHHDADRIVAHYAPLIREGLAALFPSAVLDAAVRAAYGARAGKSSFVKGSGCMVSLDLPADLLPGQPGEVLDRHITVVYAGRDVDDAAFERLCARAAEVAAGTPPLQGVISGRGEFPLSLASDGKVPVFALVGVPGLQELHEQLREFSASEHTDYRPHVTLAYVGEGEARPDPVPPTRVYFGELSVHRAGDVRTFRFSGGPPPNLRRATDSLHSCATCCLFAHPVCVMFGDTPVEPDQTCDGWELAIDDKPVAKAEEPPGLAEALRVLRERLGSSESLERALRGLYGDALLQGAHDAAHAAGSAVVGSLQGLSAGLPSDYWTSWQPGYGEAAVEAADGAMRGMLEDAGVTIRGMADTQIDTLGNRIAEGLSSGESMDAVGRALRDQVEGLPGLDVADRAEMIANTEYARAMTTAAEQTYQELGVETEEWLAEGDACIECQENEEASPTRVGEEWPNGSVPVHPNCFPAGTVVSASDVAASIARWWEGELVEIITDAGRLFAVTPNHPILTPEGWVAAGLLVQGGYVIGCTDVERVTAPIDPKNYYGPAAIEDVAESFGGASSMPAMTVPVAAEDLHGDGTGSEVCVIRTDGLLRHGRHSAISKPNGEQLLNGRHAELPGFSGDGSSDLLIDGVFTPANCRVCGCGIRSALVPSATRLLQPISGGDVSDGDSTLDERSGEGLAVGAELAGELLDRFTSEISLDPVVAIRRLPFAGHVYNLQTESGWYIANGIIVHNCRCAQGPGEPAENAAEESAEGEAEPAGEETEAEPQVEG